MKKQTRKLLTLLPMLVILTVEVSAQQIVKEATLTSQLVTTMKGLPLNASIVTQFKNDQLKIRTQAASNSSDILINRTEKKITTLVEVAGKKVGFFIMDTIDKRKMLEMVTLEEIKDSVKSINGFDCQLTYLVYDESMKLPPTTVWYAPSIKMADPTMGLNIPGIEKVNGLPVLVESNAHDVKTVYSLKQIDYSPIGDDTFKVPRNYTVMPYDKFFEYVGKITGTK